MKNCTCDYINNLFLYYSKYDIEGDKKYIIGDTAFNKYTNKKTYLILDSQIEIIQNNMEARALNIIIRKILGDNNFCY